jgi:hypothetical protein
VDRDRGPVKTTTPASTQANGVRFVAMNDITTVDHVIEAVRELSRERPVVIAQDIALEFDIDFATAVDLLNAAVRQDKVDVLRVVIEWSYDDDTPIEYDVYRPSDSENPIG